MSDERPMLRIVRGEPTAEELAAVVVVLSAAGGEGQPPPERPAESQWASPQRLQRPPVHPTGWWASGLPR